MPTTLKPEFKRLADLMPKLLLVKSGSLMPFAAPEALKDMGLCDESGITRKGDRVLDHLLALADLLDVPYT